MTARVEIDLSKFNVELEKYLDENCEDIAEHIKIDAKASTSFKDKTGRLRKSIKKKKSKFPGGGYIVKAGGKGAMQAWLVEHGHKGNSLFPQGAPPHPYLKPALDRNIAYAQQKFGVK
jgi:hypothetical protein